MLNLADQLGPGRSGPRPEPDVPAEVPVVMTDEVQHGQAGLAGRAAKAAAQLLQEDGGTLGGTQEEKGVHLGDVEAFVEEVDSEDGVDLAIPQLT